MNNHYLNNALSWKNSSIRFCLSLTITVLFFILGTLPGKYIITNNDHLILVFMLIPFATGMLSLLFSVNRIHRIGIKDLFVHSSVSHINLQKILFGFVLWFMIQTILEFIMFMKYPDNYEFGVVSVVSWLELLLIGLLLIPIQTSFEELFIRSYIMQQLFVYLRNPWISLGLTSILFATLHFGNPETSHYGIIVMLGYYLLAGFLMGAISLIDKGLELALGMHAANNIYAACFVSYKNAAFSTTTLINVDELNVYYSISLFTFGAVIFLIICAVRYHWFNKIEAN